jgi:uncharacterized membrane protein
MVPKIPTNWFFIAVGIVLSTVFLSFGVQHLVGSYYIEGPYLFLMLFFSSSMIILINGTILFVLIVLAIRKIRGSNEDIEPDSPES